MIIVEFDPGHPDVTNRVVHFNKSGDPNDYAGKDIIQAPDLSLLWDLATDTYIVPMRYWKVATGAVVQMSVSEQDVVDTIAEREIELSQLPVSPIDGAKLAVHTSTKPFVKGEDTYAVWSGCGDDIPGNRVGLGPLLHFDSDGTVGTQHIDVRFLRDAGRVWIHEGYLTFHGGGAGNSVSAHVICDPTPVQQVAALDLVRDGEYLTWAPGGPGSGTDGFADATRVALIPVPFSKNGEWDWTESGGLVPNLTKSGGYRISHVEQRAHTFINRIPCYGSSPYFTMSSNETSEIYPNYFLRVEAETVEAGVPWDAQVMMELYRQRTFGAPGGE